MDKYCAICNKLLNTSRPLTFFCVDCYNTWKDDIINKIPWTIYLKNLEYMRRRNQRNMEKFGVSVVYLGDEWDVSSEGKLVRSGFHHRYIYGKT